MKTDALFVLVLLTLCLGVVTVAVSSDPGVAAPESPQALRALQPADDNAAPEQAQRLGPHASWSGGGEARPARPGSSRGSDAESLELGKLD